MHRTGIFITNWQSALVLSVISIQQNVHSSRHGKSEKWKQIETDTFIKLGGDAWAEVFGIIFDFNKIVKSKKSTSLYPTLTHLAILRWFFIFLLSTNKPVSFTIFRHTQCLKILLDQALLVAIIWFRNFDRDTPPCGSHRR